MNKYDIVICGGGMSGLSLAYYLSLEQSLRTKKILIIEPENKTRNDRTWAFWQKGKSAFDKILSASWEKVVLKPSIGESIVMDLKNYRYKLIRGIDFYDFVQNHLQNFSNIEFAMERVIEINDFGETAVVATDENKYEAQWVFDSTYKLNLRDKKNQNMLQHFKGVVIQTKDEVFDPSTPDLMNFTIPQKDGEARFIYVLPFSETKALIEFTVFGEELLSQEEYDSQLYGYLDNELNSSYQVLEDEFGVIPMSDVPTNEFPSPRIVRIGIAGGSTNPSTGYTFANTQKRLQEIVNALVVKRSPVLKQSWWRKRHHFYASVLLNVLIQKRYPAAEVFEELYRKNRPTQVFKFLGGETNFLEEVKIMWSTRKRHFGMAALEVMKSKLFN
jgi:lycopene beta-cyclase